MLCFNCNKPIKWSKNISKFKRPCQLSTKLQNRRFDDSSFKPNSSIMKALEDIKEGQVTMRQMTDYSSKYICHECHSCLRNAVNRKFEVEQSMQQLNERKNKVQDEAREDYYKEAYYLDKSGKCWACFHEFTKEDINKAHPARINLTNTLVEGMTVQQSIELLYSEEAQVLAYTHVKRTYLCRTCLNLLKQVVRVQCQFETYNSLFNSYTHKESLFYQLQCGLKPKHSELRSSDLYDSGHVIDDVTTGVEEQTSTSVSNESNEGIDESVHLQETGRVACELNVEAGGKNDSGFEVEDVASIGNSVNLEQRNSRAISQRTRTMVESEKDTSSFNKPSKDQLTKAKRSKACSPARLAADDKDDKCIEIESGNETIKETGLEIVDNNSMKVDHGSEEVDGISSKVYSTRKRKNTVHVEIGHKKMFPNSDFDMDGSRNKSSSKVTENEGEINTKSTNFTKTKGRSYPIIKVNLQENRVSTIRHEDLEGSSEDVLQQNADSIGTVKHTDQAATDQVSSDEFVLYTNVDHELVCRPIILMLEDSSEPYRVVMCSQLADIDADLMCSSLRLPHIDLPVLWKGTVEVSQAPLICSYLWETLKLSPASKLDDLQAKQISHTCFQYLNEVTTATRELASNVLDSNKSDSGLQKFATDRLPVWLRYFDSLMNHDLVCTSELYVLGLNPSYSDYILYHALKTTEELFPDTFNNIDNVLAVNMYKEKFENRKHTM